MVAYGASVFVVCSGASVVGLESTRIDSARVRTASLIIFDLALLPSPRRRAIVSTCSSKTAGILHVISFIMI